MQTFHEYFGIAYNSVNKVIFLYLIALLLVLLTLFVINRLLRMPMAAPGKPFAKTRSPAAHSA